MEDETMNESEGLLSGVTAPRQPADPKTDEPKGFKDMSPLEIALENLAFENWLDAGAKALAAQEAKEHGDGTAKIMRAQLERDYAPELAAIVKKSDDAQSEFLDEWKEFIAFMRDAGVALVPPGAVAVAAYLDELVKQGASEDHIKLARA
jgi:hypothetical protein